ncbi:MAG: gldE [Chitinophagaceae bacterium]|nr:gldE [Chitinophagaceae bacterium]
MDYHPVVEFPFLFFAANPQGTTVLAVLLLFLLLFSFIIAGAEVAFFSLTFKDINHLKTKQLPVYDKIVDLMEHPKALLGSMLIGNSLVNISIIIISNLLIDDLFPFTNQVVEFLVKVVAVTFMLVLFGEIMPKVMATQNNIRFAKDVAPFIEVVFYLFKGISSWMSRFSDVIERMLANKKNGAYSQEEMNDAIDLTDSKEKNILKGIVKFGDITVKQVMRGRLDVHGIDYDTALEDLVKQVEELHYSRLPVYNDTLDQVAGILYTKDLLPYLDGRQDFDWHRLLRPPYFVHEQKLIEDLLQEFQSRRIHFAIVVDEFGGTSGIVTLEDILEEIIGEIKDEFDEEESNYKKLDDNNYIFEGKTPITDVCRIMGLSIDTFDEVKGESDSLAGLVLELAGDIPPVNKTVPCGDFEFTVIEVEKNRLNKIKATIKMRLQ